VRLPLVIFLLGLGICLVIYASLNRFEWNFDGNATTRIDRWFWKAELCDINRSDYTFACGKVEIQQMKNSQ
jgi:hypothetical protein|tara:strand:- start:848 stop:1060 length:213 start_codon:yes stop_codon:yes gene_type:complete